MRDHQPYSLNTLNAVKPNKYIWTEFTPYKRFNFIIKSQVPNINALLTHFNTMVF